MFPGYSLDPSFNLLCKHSVHIWDTCSEPFRQPKDPPVIEYLHLSSTLYDLYIFAKNNHAIRLSFILSKITSN